MKVEFDLRKTLSVILGGMVGASVAACSSMPGASTLHHMTAPPAKKVASFQTTHTVRRGDTLYSIAEKYKVDYVALAMVNDVPDGSTIKPKQKLRIPR